MRQMRTLDGAITWEDFDGAPMTNLPTRFRMPEIKRYTNIGFSCIHLRLYSTVMRAHGLDEAQMIILFPMSLNGKKITSKRRVFQYQSFIRSLFSLSPSGLLFPVKVEPQPVEV
ncbi:hypothetical protein AAG906_030897 [Vitis piasezkii]